MTGDHPYNPKKDDAHRWAKKRGKKKWARPKGFNRFLREVGTLGRMAKAVAKGEYDLATPKIVMMLGTLGYVVSPIDLIPDFILGLGMTDDMALVAGTVSVMAYELAQFREWEKGQKRKTKRAGGEPTPA